MPDHDRQVWDSMLAHLRAAHSPICRQWFAELIPVGIAGGSLQLRTSSPLHRDYLRRQCGGYFTDAAQAVTGQLLSVRFLGPDDPAELPPPKPRKNRDANKYAKKPSTASSLATPQVAPTPVAQPEAPARLPELPTIPIEVLAPPAPEPGIAPRYESLVINPDYAFENFVQGPGNRLALAAALAVSSNPGKTYNPYFVHGGVGLGKSHLLQAICLKIVESNPRAVLYYISCEAFVTQFIESVQSGHMADFRHRFRDVDVLVIDDIHFLTKRDRSQEEFFHTFNALFQANKQIILSSDAPPEDIPDLEDRLVSRFKWGLVCKIDAPDYETRVEIVKAKARLRGLTIPAEVAELIAERLTSNIRELEGAVVKLQIQSVVDKRPIDLDLARAALGDEPRNIVGEPTIQNIIDVVTEHYDCRLADLQSKHRQKSIALPRQVCMYLTRLCTRHSLEEIGGFFGGRDHTTVMHSLRSIEIKKIEDPEFAANLKVLEDRVQTSRPIST